MPSYRERIYTAAEHLMWAELRLFDLCSEFADAELADKFKDLNLLDIALDLFGIPQDNSDILSESEDGFFCRDGFYNEFGKNVIASDDPAPAIDAYIKEILDAIRRYAEEFDIDEDTQ